MKDPDDCYTLDMLPAADKRGRGRPRKDNALTPAQRAKRYRDNRCMASNAKPSTLTWFFPKAQSGSLADMHGFRQP